MALYDEKYFKARDMALEAFTELKNVICENKECIHHSGYNKTDLEYEEDEMDCLYDGNLSIGDGGHCEREAY